MLRLHTLGRFELVRASPAGRELISVQPKRLALLAYLAIGSRGGPCRRDTLLALFWPESGEEEARRALRQALYYLRNAVGDGVLISRPDESVAVAPTLWCDAAELSALAESGQPAEALAVYGGDFLAGVHLPEVSAELEQWIDGTRARLRALAAAAAWRASDQSRAAGGGAAAIAAARRAVELMPDDEAGVRRLIELLDGQGDRLGALAVYEDLVRRLDRDYGAEPSAESQALGARLRAHVSPRAAVPEPVRANPPHSREPEPAGPSRRTRWTVPLAVAAALLAGAALVLRAPARDAEASLLGEGPAAGRDRILVADLANNTRDSLLAGAIGEALRVDLAQSPLVTVLSSQQVRGALDRMQRADESQLTEALAREVALREGARAYVAGSVGAVGRGYVIAASLVVPESGEVLAMVKESAADSTRLLDALDRVGRELRRRLGESIPSARAAAPLEQVTTPSLRALRLYSEAVRAAERDGDERRAYELLREAVAVDTGFAMAWRKLSAVAGNLGEPVEAQDASKRAFVHRDRLPDRERYLTSALYYTAAGRAEDAIRAYATLLELYPTDVRATFNTGFIHAQLRDFRRAEEYRRRALALDPANPIIQWNLGLDLLNGGKLDAAAAQTRATLQRFPEFENALWLEVDIAIARGDLDFASRRTRELLAEAQNAGRYDRALRTLASLSLMRGRVREAEGHLRELETILRREWRPSERAVVAGHLGFLEAWFRRSGVRAVEVMERALDDVRLDTLPMIERQAAYRAYIYALAGRTDRALALVEEARAAGPIEGLGRGAELLRAEGAARLEQGRVTEAVALLRRSVDDHFCPICSLPDLARAYERAGQTDSAAAIYQRYLDLPWSERWSSDGEFTGHVLLRLGELREDFGDTAGAAASYRRFVELWREADPELRPMVERAQRRLEALTAGAETAPRAAPSPAPATAAGATPPG